VLRECEWGHDDYSLNVANLPEAPHSLDSPDAPKPVSKNGKKRVSGKTSLQEDLFSEGART
jgi:adenine-specific DNA-methyltransferase